MSPKEKVLMTRNIKSTGHHDVDVDVERIPEIGPIDFTAVGIMILVGLTAIGSAFVDSMLFRAQLVSMLFRPLQSIQMTEPTCLQEVESNMFNAFVFYIIILGAVSPYIVDTIFGQAVEKAEKQDDESSTDFKQWLRGFDGRMYSL